MVIAIASRKIDFVLADEGWTGINAAQLIKQELRCSNGGSKNDGT